MEHPPLTAAAASQQQQQLQQHHQQQSTTETQEDAFDSVRQAAAAMFKQRTKDLTRLAEVEAQCQDVEAELRQAQGCVAQLTAQQAALDAVVDEEQQRTRQREACLQELHSALLQLDEEQQTSSRLQHAAEAAIAAATAFIGRFTDPDGRLFELLTNASVQTAGRSARELQGLLAAVRQGLTAVAAHQQRLRTTPSLSAAAACDDDDAEVVRTVQAWAAKVDWGRHRELVDAVQAMQCLLNWTTRCHEAHAEEGAEGVDGDTGAWPPLPSCVAGAATDESGGDADAHHWRSALRLEPTRKDPNADEEPLTAPTTAPPDDDVMQLVQAELISPLDALLTYSTELTTACVQHRTCPPSGASSLAVSVAAARAQWEALRVAWQEWRAEARRSREAVRAAAVAEQQLAAAQDVLEVLRQRGAAQAENTAARTAELAQSGALQRTHHAAAWARGLRALEAQRASLQATHVATSAAEAEARQAAEELELGAALNQQACHAVDAELAEQQAQATAARQSTAAAEARIAELEVEYAEVQRVQQLVRDQHAALLSCAAPRPPGHTILATAAAGAAKGVIEPLHRLTAACLPLSPTCHAWASHLAAAAAAESGDPALTTATSVFFTRLAAASDGAGVPTATSFDADGLRAALTEASFALQLPDGVLAEDVVDTELLGELPRLRELSVARQATAVQAEEHCVFMSDATAELTLLRSELASADP